MRFTHPLVVAALIGFSLVAFAGGDYTTESQKVDQMMAKTKMLPSTTDEARKLRADADRMMKEGKEKEAMELLVQVKTLLGMKK